MTEPANIPLRVFRRLFHLLGRLLVWLLTHTVYRLRVMGRQNIPREGGALFVCNHLSFVDMLFLMASNRRPVRFLMLEDMYEKPWFNPFVRMARAIPVSADASPRKLVGSLRQAREAIASGELVCIFAEGQITRIGNLLPFRPGLEHIMKGLKEPIIPVALDGLWGSIFSFQGGRFLWKLPRRIPFPVAVSYGRPLPADSPAGAVRQAVQDLLTDSFRQRRFGVRPLHRGFLAAARRHPFRFALADQRAGAMTYATLLMRAIFLARRLNPVWRNQPMVGILLPSSAAGVLVNLAATLTGRVAVNLNYTSSEGAIASSTRQCDLKTIVTSRAFLERVPLQLPGEVILLEDLAAAPRSSEKLLALLMAWLLPARLLERLLGRKRTPDLDELATVIFSSGSTGDPKGVMLTHYNIVANVEQLHQQFLLSRDDCLVGVLPLFHSFGYTVTIWLPLYLGISIVYHPNPLEAQAVGDLVERYKATFLLATPSFLQAYMRRVPPEQFRSLNLVVVGAEKLPARLEQAFHERYGVRPMEGYGCTECAPVVAVNTRDFRGPGIRQRGSKPGSIGRPLPGISVRIVDPDSFQPLAVGTPGLLLVRGPNVMQGYLGRPDRTAEAIRGGWYITGDIARLDEDGFLTITDRLSRFSKIAGEMVPHVRIEDKLHELAEARERLLVVTAVPDLRKGERLVVLHTLEEEHLREVLKRLPESELPPLWRPKPDQFHRVEELPVLGSGKLDLRRVKEVATELAGVAQAVAND